MGPALDNKQGANDAVPATHHQVQASICIKLCSKPCLRVSGHAPEVSAGPPAPADTPAARRVSLSGASKTASIKVGAEPAAINGNASDAASQQQQHTQQIHTVHVKFSGLDGLQQEVQGAAGSWVQAGPDQSQEAFSIQLQSLQLAVTEQRVRDWAAAAGQLQVHIAVMDAAMPEPAAKKTAGAAAAKSAAAAAAATTAAVASGTFTVNCAGLLTGDTSVRCCWGSLPPAEGQQAPEDGVRLGGAAEPFLPPSEPPSTSHDSPSEQPRGLQAASQAAVTCCVPQSRFKWSLQPPSGDLQEWLEGVEVQLQLFKPSSTPAGAGPGDGTAGGKPQSAGKPVAAKAAAGKPSAAAAIPLSTGADTAEAPPAAEHLPPEPCSLLSPALAALLNPVVMHVYKACALPDAPATRQQLDTLCQPVQLKMAWPPLVPGAQQQAAGLSQWQVPSGVIPPTHSSSSDALAMRCAAFAVPTIVLGGDVGPAQLMQLCRSTALQLQLHDRSALPEPAPFTAARMQQRQQQQPPAPAPSISRKAGAKISAVGSTAAKSASVKTTASPASAEPVTAAAAAPAQGGVACADNSTAQVAAAAVSDGEVYGAAAVSLLDLARGSTSCCFSLPLQPVSTIRGGACLDWKSRPGRYLEAHARIKGWVRCAVSLHLISTPQAADAVGAALGTGVNAAPSPAAVSGAPNTTASAAAAAPAPPATTAAAAGKPPPAGKAGKTTQAAAGGKAAAAAGAGASQEPIARSTSSAAVEAEPLSGAAVPGTVSNTLEQDQVPQPSAHVLLPSELRYQGTMTRAVFRMDYRDSDLLHVLEDAVRQHNAIVLGLAPPPPPSAEELAAAQAAEAAAAAAAAAAAQTAASVGAGPQQGRSRPTSAQAAAARSPMGPASKAGAPAAAPPSTVSSPGGQAALLGPQEAALASKAAARRSSAAAATQAGTPRSILKPTQAAGKPALGLGLTAEPSALTSGMASSRQASQQPQQQLRASFAGTVASCGRKPTQAAEVDSSSDSDDTSEHELSEADQRLQSVLQQYEHVELDQRLLQVLSTYQLSADQVCDAGLDVLTGFQLVDGALRLFVLEGPAAGKAMQVLVPAVARWALEDQEDEQRHLAQEEAQQLTTACGTRRAPQQQQQRQQQHTRWLPRQVLFHPSIRYPVRLYGTLGVDVWMLKLHDALAALGGRASTYTGHVRPDCIAGMHCLLGMVQGYAHSPAAARDVDSKATCQDTATGPHRALREGGSGTAVRQPPSQPCAGMVLMRQLDQYQLFPTAQQLHLVDKKFGGELTKADLLGVEAEEPSSDEEDEEEPAAGQHSTTAVRCPGGTTADGPGKAPQQLTGSHAAAAAVQAASAKLQVLLADSTDMAAAPDAGPAARSAKSLRSRRSSRRSGRFTGNSRRSGSHGRGRSSSSRKKRRAFQPKHPLDMDNSVYLHLRMEAHRRRVQRDIHTQHLQALQSLEASKQPLRDAWASWNPQRAVAKELQQQIEEGAITLEDTIRAAHAACCPPAPQAPGPGGVNHPGTYPHAQPFMWPAPRQPDTYNTHPLKPSEYRVEELQEPWQEVTPVASAAAAQASGRGAGDTDSNGREGFVPLCRPSPTGLFTQDPGYWQTVHLGGDDWEAFVAQQAESAKAAWAAKVVVKDIHFHGLPGTGDKAAAQADRLSGLLKGRPIKKGFKLAHTPPAPVSMHAELPWEPATAVAASAAGSLAAQSDKSKWVSQQDFNALCNKQRTALAKPGFSDAATAALHDKVSV